ncbi:MAG: hypothetical protein JJV99_10245, partial [Colwellia sp.]|nr:hypothetical protein [Colwellia sp.]
MNKIDCQSASDIIIFGVLGDLSRRKLLPALYQLERCDLINTDSRIIGVARQEYSVEAFKGIVIENLENFINEALEQVVLERFINRFLYQQLDMKDVNAYEHLANTLLITPSTTPSTTLPTTPPTANNTHIYYFSTPPA